MPSMFKKTNYDPCRRFIGIANSAADSCNYLSNVDTSTKFGTHTLWGLRF